MKLVIISHTEHYLTADGTIVGWGSTVTELNHLIDIFDKITHVAMLHSVVAPSSALPYLSDKIEFVALPAVGGSGILNKLEILSQLPKIIGIIRTHLKTADCFQFRAPTGMGVFVIPYLVLFSNKKGWFKYAGNWKQENAPFAYKLQKWFLERQSRFVTLNGFWEGQPKHCLSFENPCLTEAEVVDGQRITKEKRLNAPINICFVGRLEPAKGLDLLLEAIGSLNDREREKIGTIHLVGDGDRLSYYQTKAAALKVHFIFHGFLAREDVQTIYKDSHAIVLPSASEGFPKVIAEGMNYGCIPIVSNVSSIGQYIIHEENGYLLNDLTSLKLQRLIVQFLNLKEVEMLALRSGYADFVSSFTYAHYNNRLKREVLSRFF